jgi:hypothetical protein
MRDYSLSRLEILTLMEFIGASDFFGCSRLKEVLFEAGSHLGGIEGFKGCGSLIRIDISGSIELIGFSALSGCSGLKEVLFEAGSHLRRIDGFQFCRSLIRIDIPSSVELIDFSALSGCSRLKEVIFETGQSPRTNGWIPGLPVTDPDEYSCISRVHRVFGLLRMCFVP